MLEGQESAWPLLKSSFEMGTTSLSALDQARPFPLPIVMKCHFGLYRTFCCMLDCSWGCYCSLFDRKNDKFSMLFQTPPFAVVRFHIYCKFLGGLNWRWDKICVVSASHHRSWLLAMSFGILAEIKFTEWSQEVVVARSCHALCLTLRRSQPLFNLLPSSWFCPGQKQHEPALTFVCQFLGPTLG